MAYENLTRAIIGAESGGNPYAQSNKSSAGGAGQFIDSTWLDMVRKHRPDIAQGKTDQQLLQLKYDPSLSAEMTQAYASDNANYLKSRGVPNDNTALSLAHFAGPDGAVTVYADPTKTVRELLGPRVVEKNPFTRNMTGNDLIRWAGKRVGSKTPEQSLAQSVANRYGGAQQAPQQQQVGATNADLQSSLKNSYDPRKLSQAQGLIKSGQELADTKNPNWLSALGATALAGYGGYLEDKQAEQQKLADTQTNEGLQNAGNLTELAKVLMKSPDKDKQNAGLSLLAKALTPTTSKPTDDMREYELARQQGYKGSFTDYMLEMKKAGRTQVTTNIGEKGFNKKLGEELGKAFVEQRTAAKDAAKSLVANQNARELLSEGMITGTGAEYILNFGKALNQLGINYSGDAIANTEAFLASRAQEVAQIIKAFGAGTGLSDADREFAEKAAGGKITMTKESIQRILNINDRASRNVIKLYNEEAAKIPKKSAPFDLTVEMPKIRNDATQPPMKITNDADYDSLPAGSTYIGPDGALRRKQ